MTNNEEIRKLLREIVKQESGYSRSCRVVSVNSKKNTCVCEPLDGGAYFTDVIFGLQNYGSRKLPKVDSVVIVSFLDKNNAFISMHSDVTKHSIRTTQDNGTTDVSLNKSLIDLKESIKTYTQSIENSLNAIVLPTVVGPTSGPPANIAQFIAARVSLDTSLTKFEADINNLLEA